jgi:hypothetical protein
MKRGMSLIESMISLFLSGILIISSGYYIKDINRIGKVSEKISNGTGEKAISIMYIIRIIRDAGEGIDYSLGIEVEKDAIIVRKSNGALVLKEDAHKGDNYIKIYSAKIKKGNKIVIDKTLYKIISVAGDCLMLDKGLKQDISVKNGSIKIIKEYKISYLKKRGVLLKIGRGHNQLITDKLKKTEFSMFNDWTLRIKGLEMQSGNWKEFELYIVLPILAINGERYERF